MGLDSQEQGFVYCNAAASGLYQKLSRCNAREIKRLDNQPLTFFWSDFRFLNVVLQH